MFPQTLPWASLFLIFTNGSHESSEEPSSNIKWHYSRRKHSVTQACLGRDQAWQQVMWKDISNWGFAKEKKVLHISMYCCRSGHLLWQNDSKLWTQTGRERDLESLSWGMATLEDMKPEEEATKWGHHSCSHIFEGLSQDISFYKCVFKHLLCARHCARS